jgi:hypothetical protein
MVKILFIHKQTGEKFICVNTFGKEKLTEVFSKHFGLNIPGNHLYIQIFK